MRKLDLFQEKNDTQIFSGPEITIAQSFVPTKNNLSGIRLFAFNPMLGGKKTYTFVIKGSEGDVLRTMSVSESNLGWASELRYDFPEIKEAKNKKFYISVIFDSNNPKEPEDTRILSLLNDVRLNQLKTEKGEEETIDRVQKKYTSFAYSRGDNYKSGNAFINEKQLNGDIVFKSYYTTYVKESLTDSMNQFGERLYSDGSFFIFFFLVITAIVTIILRRIRSFYLA